MTDRTRAFIILVIVFTIFYMFLFLDRNIIIQRENLHLINAHDHFVYKTTGLFFSFLIDSPRPVSEERIQLECSIWDIITKRTIYISTRR